VHKIWKDRGESLCELGTSSSGKGSN